MKQFKIMLLMIDILMSNMAQQWYEMRTKPPFFVANCTERYVVSLLLCAAIGREAKEVIFTLTVIITTVHGIVHSCTLLV